MRVGTGGLVALVGEPPGSETVPPEAGSPEGGSQAPGAPGTGGAGWRNGPAQLEPDATPEGARGLGGLAPLPLPPSAATEAFVQRALAAMPAEVEAGVLDGLVATGRADVYVPEFGRALALLYDRASGGLRLADPAAPERSYEFLPLSEFAARLHVEPSALDARAYGDLRTALAHGGRLPPKPATAQPGTAQPATAQPATVQLVLSRSQPRSQPRPTARPSVPRHPGVRHPGASSPARGQAEPAGEADWTEGLTEGEAEFLEREFAGRGINDPDARRAIAREVASGRRTAYEAVVAHEDGQLGWAGGGGPPPGATAIAAPGTPDDTPPLDNLTIVRSPPRPLPDLTAHQRRMATELARQFRQQPGLAEAIMQQAYGAAIAMDGTGRESPAAQDRAVTITEEALRHLSRGRSSAWALTAAINLPPSWQSIARSQAPDLDQVRSLVAQTDRLEAAYRRQVPGTGGNFAYSQLMRSLAQRFGPDRTGLPTILDRIRGAADVLASMPPGFLGRSYSDETGAIEGRFHSLEASFALRVVQGTDPALLRDLFASRRFDPQGLSFVLKLNTTAGTTAPRPSPQALDLMARYLSRRTDSGWLAANVVLRIATGEITTLDQARQMESEAMAARRRFEVPTNQAALVLERRLWTSPTWSANLSVARDGRAYISDSTDGVPPGYTNDQLLVNLRIGHIDGLDPPWLVTERAGDTVYGLGFSWKLPGEAPEADWHHLTPDQFHTAIQLPSGSRIRFPTSPAGPTQEITLPNY